MWAGGSESLNSAARGSCCSTTSNARAEYFLMSSISEMDNQPANVKIVPWLEGDIMLDERRENS